MKKTLIASIGLASVLCLGLAVSSAQAQDLGGQKKKMPDGPPPNLDNERLGDNEPGPPVIDDPVNPDIGDKTPRRCALDIDASGSIDTMDIIEVLLQWGDCDSGEQYSDPDGLGTEPRGPADEPCPADVNDDRRVDMSDLLMVLFNLNKKCRDGDIVGLP